MWLFVEIITFLKNSRKLAKKVRIYIFILIQFLYLLIVFIFFRWFILDSGKHEIRYYDSHRCTKQKVCFIFHFFLSSRFLLISPLPQGTISLQIRERRIAKKEKITDNDKLNALFDENNDKTGGGGGGEGGGRGWWEWGEEEEEGGGGGGEGGVGGRGRGFLEGSSMMVESADVSVQNVVTHRGQFKVGIIYLCVLCVEDFF